MVSFHLAYAAPGLSLFVLPYLGCLFQLTRLGTGRSAFYFGLAIGMATVSPQLSCFFRIFGAGAIALWLVISAWIALFLLLSQTSRVRFGPLPCALLAPFLWAGIEYFRSELYYLRFSWLNPGYAFAGGPLQALVHWAGMYGLGFLCVSVVAVGSTLREALSVLRAASPPFSLKATVALGVVLVSIFALSVLPAFLSRLNTFPRAANPPRQLTIAGIQLEFPSEADLLSPLDKLHATEPRADLLMLSEYTLDGPVPEKIRLWCREHHRYLLVGGKAQAPEKNFYDTAFVVGPEGTIVFEQVKSVPIQFFNDGLPAAEQKLWDSPWGKIGICICYDLSYTRVTDRLVRAGAEAILVPTMDVIDWGRWEHLLHARVAPIRAAEYGIPVARVASSGISQILDRTGRTLAAAPFPGQNEIIRGTTSLAGPGSFPLDRFLAPVCVVIVVLYILVLGFLRFRREHGNSNTERFGALNEKNSGFPS